MQTDTQNTDEAKCSEALTVFHDGGCPVCRAEVSLMKRLDTDGGIEWVDITAADEPLRAANISYSDAMERIHVRDASGQLLTGVEGFMAVWAKLRGYRRVVPFVRHVPGVLPLLRLLYAGFARIRLRIYRRRIAEQQ
jgi:predicted DCC family thiol-disulfide oxidoreductase YuxK